MELTCRGLTKHYGEFQALKGIDLKLTQGIYGLLGPNGAGKSTLMNLLVGNLAPTAGQIRYNRRNIRVCGEAFRSVLGFMPQQQALYPTFTARRFLDYVAALRGMSPERAKKRIEWALEMVELQQQGDKRIQSFSGGMKQRLLIAQAILDDPKVLILDEPTAGLDPKQRIAIRNLIARIALDKIVIIATHVVSDVEYIAKEFILLKQGQVLQQGDRSQLVSTLEGKVFELAVPEDTLEELGQRYTICNIARGDQGVYVRVLAEEPPADFPAQPQRPTMEDVYLWHFGEETHETTDSI